MAVIKKCFPVILSLLVLVVVLPAGPILAEECDCVSDSAVPAFLAAGVDPAVLLIIDNSASMYDVAYVEGEVHCFDDSFSAANSYAGYFSETDWYTYDGTDNRFEVTVDPEDCPAVVGGVAYSNDDVCIQVTETTVADVTTVTLDGFTATGKFLNWASASKFDIEKKILTGGKYDPATGELESEGRGCEGERFVRQVAVTRAGNTYQLTLGVRADADPTDAIDTTLIDIFAVTTDGFDPAKCQEAIDLLTGDPEGFGQVKQAIIDCMEYSDLQPSKGDHDKQALTHSLHDCWYLAKKGDWPGGGAQGFNFEKWCEEKYALMDPQEITRDDPAYVCSGDGSTAAEEADSYIGECWNPGEGCSTKTCTEATSLEEKERCKDGVIQLCTDWNKGKGECKKEEAWQTVVECEEGGVAAGWKYADKDLEDCIERARERFCGVGFVPDVVDPSDPAQSSGTTYGIPALLIGQGAAAQLDNPVATLQGVVQAGGTPSGLLQKYATTLRVGAMSFNDYGSASEDLDPWPSDKDGAMLVKREDGTFIGISKGAAHAEEIAAGVNAMKAVTWTPLAEAVYNAVGYYTQDAGKRINADDFPISAADDPNLADCQENNILVITDGGSTADLNESVKSFAMGAGADGDGTDSADGCDLYGSTFLDDLTYYAHETEEIKSFFVVNGTPRDSGAGECNPTTLLNNAAANGGSTAPYVAEDPEQLADTLDDLFSFFLTRASAGSAASVIAATRSGEGAVYQAIFWPNMQDTEGTQTVTWGGEVHALLVNDQGELYEDTNENRTLDDGDQRVVFFFNGSETMACYGEVDANGVCLGSIAGLHDVKYLWSASEWLAGIPNTDAGINANRDPVFNYLSNESKRYIFTWDDLNNNGAVDDASELLDFVPENGAGVPTDWAGLIVSGGRTGTVLDDFNLPAADRNNDGVNKIVSWVRGYDDPDDDTLRKRAVPTPVNFDITGDPESIIWRLGDIVHSTPTAVGKPAEVYHLIYQDQSYADFYQHYTDSATKRRHVIYFGGNDGMLHAVNGGFYNSAEKKFCLTRDCADEETAMALGAELWAYVPYNLLPHLKCLIEPNGPHHYYMDLKPRIFDVKIFDEDDVHIGGWGTILVAGMRLGGSEVDTPDGRKLASAYMIFDITDPDQPPALLGEMTTASGDLGFTTAIPTVVPMKEGASYKWYLVLGSGPTEMDGTSDQKPRIAVFPLDDLDINKRFWVPTGAPAGDAGGTIELSGSANGYVSDPITVDFNLVRNYRGDAVYFGTVEGTWGGWGGKMYRWVTQADAGITAPSAWKDPNTTLLIDPGRPVTASASVGWDGFNYWVYFGTGRFFDEQDKTDASSNGQDAYYGLKEPMDMSRAFTWAEIDPSFDGSVTPLDSTPPGERGVLRVDQIRVQEAVNDYDATLSCEGAAGCLPDGGSIDSFDLLDDYIGGTGFARDDAADPLLITGYTGLDGWYMEFQGDPADPLAAGERNLGQATLLGGLVTFTTYMPVNDICEPEGKAALYGVYYRTGTAWHEAVFGDDEGGDVDFRKDIGHGLGTTPNLHVGREEGAKALVQTSTGAIVEIEQPNLPLDNLKTGQFGWRID